MTLRPGDLVRHPTFGDGRVMEVDTTSFRVDLDTPIPFVTVLFFRSGLIYRPASEMEHLLPQNV